MRTAPIVPGMMKPASKLVIPEDSNEWGRTTKIELPPDCRKSARSRLQPDDIHERDHGHTERHALSAQVHGPNFRDIDELHAVQAKVIRDFNEE